MKPVDVKPNMYIDLNKENNKKGTKFKVGFYVRISTWKKYFFQKPNFQIDQKKFLWLKKL